MDLRNSELGSCNKTHITPTLAGNEMVGIEDEKETEEEEEDQEPTTIPVIKTEPNVSCVPVVSVTHISCRLYPELLPLYQCVLVKQKFDSGKWTFGSFSEKNFFL